jgi:hypothetical protein
MEKMWLVVAEIVAKSEGSSQSEIGFMNITTWADSKEAASLKIGRYLNSFGWNMVEVDRADVIDEDCLYGDEVADMIDRTRNKRNAIILGDVSYVQNKLIL